MKTAPLKAFLRKKKKFIIAAILVIAFLLAAPAILFYGIALVFKYQDDGDFYTWKVPAQNEEIELECGTVRLEKIRQNSAGSDMITEHYGAFIGRGELCVFSGLAVMDFLLVEHGLVYRVGDTDWDFTPDLVLRTGVNPRSDDERGYHFISGKTCECIQE